jgi:hypothetical protein
VRGDAAVLTVRPAVRRHSAWLFLALAAVAVLAAAAPVAGYATVRLAVAACLVALAVVQWTEDWPALVVALTVWLVLFALLRRLLTEATGRVGADPLLLVAPIVFGLLVVSAYGAGALTRRTALTTAVLALGGLTVVQSVNVSQAPLLAGVAGLLFVLTPQLAFWPGRAVGTAALERTLKVFAVLAIGVAGYGLWQTFVGLLPWDRRWVVEAGYEALNVGGVIRAFGTSASSAEYASVAAVAIVCWLTLPIAKRSVTIAAVAVLGAALVLASSRGPVVLLIVALAMVTAARFAVPAAVAIALTAAATLMVPVVATLLVPHATEAGAGTSALLQHQVEGLANPLDAESSTLIGHTELARQGLASAWHHPLGQGIGVISLGQKFGGADLSTETDLSNVAVAFGVLGIVVFGALVLLGLSRAYWIAARTRGPLALATVGILVVTTNQWLNGGMYGIAWLPWLLLGWLDRPDRAEGGADDG